MNEFVRRMLIAGPFMAGPAHEARVEAIHAEHFDRLLNLVERVRTAGESSVAVVCGSPGAGKTELLERLGVGAERQRSAYVIPFDPTAADAAAPLRGVAAAAIRRLARNDRGDWRRTPLYALVRAALDRALERPVAEKPSWTVGEAWSAFRRFLDPRLKRGDAGFGDAMRIYGALFRFVVLAERKPGPDRPSRTLQRMVRWLTSQPPAPEEEASLGRAAVDGAEHVGRQPRLPSPTRLMGVLGDMAGLCGRTLVVCCDRLDACAPDRVCALANDVDLLVREARNLAVILCCRSSTSIGWTQAPSLATGAHARANAEKTEIALGPLSADEARRMLIARLEAAIEPFYTVPAVRQRRREDPLFPLGTEWFTQRIAGASLTAGAVLGLAAERWSQQQDRLRALGPAAWLEGCPPAGPDGAVVDRCEDGAALCAPAEDLGESATCLSLLTEQAYADAAWSEPDGAAVKCSPPAIPSKQYRLERVLLGATAVLWLAIGAAIWRRSEVPPKAENTAASRIAATFPSEIATSPVAEAPGAERSGRQPESPARDAIVPRPGDRAAVEPAAPVEPSAAESPSAVTMVEAPDVSTAPAISAAAPPTAYAPTADAALAQHPADPIVAPATVPSSTMSGSLSTQNPAGAASGLPAAGIPRAPGRAATPTAAAAPSPPGTQVPRGPYAAGNGVRGGQEAGNVPPGYRASRVGGLNYGAGAGGTTPRGLGGGALRPVSPPVKPIAVVADPELERVLNEAWGLIERGDHGPGRMRLLQARKLNGDDPRADFSLGLLDGMLQNDWNAAEKRFADCVRRDPMNVPSLNNLAIAQVQNRHQAEAVKRWQTIVSQRAATPEVVQSIGHARALFEKGEIRASRAVVKAMEEVYTEAAVATLASARPQGGFQLMPLQLSDGRQVGWNDLRKMQYTAPPSATPSSSNTAATIAGRLPAVTVGAPLSGVAPVMPMPPRMQSTMPNMPSISPEQIPVSPRYGRTRR